jgi:hypothetical protein
MSDEPTPTTESADDQPPSETQAAEDSPESDTDTSHRMVRYAQWAAFAFLLLVALLATLRLYFAMSATIDTFVTRRYRPLFMAGFNLAVLLGCGIGLSALVRRLT